MTETATGLPPEKKTEAATKGRQPGPATIIMNRIIVTLVVAITVLAFLWVVAIWISDWKRALPPTLLGLALVAGAVAIGVRYGLRIAEIRDWISRVSWAIGISPLRMVQRKPWQDSFEWRVLSWPGAPRWREPRLSDLRWRRLRRR